MNDADFAEIFADPRVKPEGAPQSEDDPFHSADYQRFVESMVPHCRCSANNRPCDGVLAGGLCDNIQDDPVDEPDDDEPDYDAPRPPTPLENWQRNDEHNVR